jgi:hypothetical protein
VQPAFRLSNKKTIIAVLVITPLYIVFILPFLNNVVFDAVVHFSYAEKFWQGLPFRYNSTNEDVLASTSPFWTLLIILFYFIAGYKAILLLKIFILTSWIAVTCLLYLAARDIFRFTAVQLLILVAYWLVNVSVLKNSFGGMENVLAALQLMLIYYLSRDLRYKVSYQKIFLLSAIAGWTLLTRPEIGFIAALIYFIFLTNHILQNEVNFRKSLIYFFVSILIIAVVLVPYYVYQYSATGKIISDSSYARMNVGHWNSIVIIRGFLYFHPSLLFTLLVPFFPLTAGFFVKLMESVRELKTSIKRFSLFFNWLAENSLIIIVIYASVFYSFVVGGDQIGRYLLPVYPVFFILGFAGLFKIYYLLKKKSPLPSKIFALAITLFFLAVNSYDYYSRIILHKGEESNVTEQIEAPAKRTEVTSGYLKNLGFKNSDTIKVATTEVQYRYYVDDRIQVVSLDGRSSSKVMEYADRDGFPDFEKFIEDVKPDIVEVKGWSDYINQDNFMDRTFRMGRKKNILSQWDNRIRIMKIGESFNWNNIKVTYIAPYHVKINWNK